MSVYSHLADEIEGYTRAMSILSMTGSGIIVLIIGTALSHFGIQVGTDQITAVVDAALQIVGIVLSIWGQLRRPDLVAGMVRRNRL